MGHRHGESRKQAALFPLLLDDLVANDSLVQVIDVWVDTLDLAKLGFLRVQPQVRGAPPYNPADLLKLYIWGYLNSVRSSRDLERECHRDVECMWLLGRLAPDHKTISEFRRNHKSALVAACAAFVQFAQAQRLVASRTVAIDGTKIRAVASRKGVRDKKALEEQARRNAQEIAEYLKVLDTQDREDACQQPSSTDIKRALDKLERERQEIQAQVQQLAERGSDTVVQTELDAQAMHSLHGAPGYNLQTVVEVESHLIVAHAVTNDRNDQQQLQPMAERASEVLGEPCTALADTGYSNAEQIARLDEQGVTCFVALRRSSNSHGDGQLYDKSVFIYDCERNCFTCPQGKVLKQQSVHRRDKLVMYAAGAKDCRECAAKAQCTNAKYRQVSRHLYEDALRANAKRLEDHPEMLQIRQQTVEHPYDFIKNRVFVNGRLLLRGLAGAEAESSLAVLAYNFKRVFNMKGGAWMRQAMGV